MYYLVFAYFLLCVAEILVNGKKGLQILLWVKVVRKERIVYVCQYPGKSSQCVKCLVEEYRAGMTTIYDLKKKNDKLLKFCAEKNEQK